MSIQSFEKLVSQRFEELIISLDDLEKTKENPNSSLSKNYVDSSLFVGWRIRAKDILIKVCGKDSCYFIDFIKIENKEFSIAYSNYQRLQDLKAIILNAKEDFEKGYFISSRSVIQAEIFDSELEQAKELFKSGYITAAAVIAGVVLETTLRELCDNCMPKIKHGKLDVMNTDLYKVHVYNKLTKKRITFLADIRNSAAHGKSDQFTKQDVEEMLQYVGKFIEDYLNR